MDAERFAGLVERLERESAASPRGYLLKVALLALVGFGLMLMLLGLASLGLLIVAGVAVAALFSGGTAILALLKFGKLLFLLAVPLWFLMRAALTALFTRLPPPQGEAVSRQQAPALFDALDRMRRTLKGPRVHQVLLVDEVNAAVVQRPLFGLFGFPRNHLLLGLPLLESMSPDEALAVVAHEYGHLAGSHGHFGSFIYRLRLSWSSIDAVAGRWQGWAGRRLAGLVAWYAPYFNAYTFVLARANEYQADQAAADLVGVPVVAAALKRVNMASPQHRAFMGETFDAIAREPRPPADLAQRWAGAAAQPAAEARDWLAEALDRRPGLSDTHPALRQRLSALPDTAQTDLAEPPPARSGPSAAEAWLGDTLPGLRRLFESRWAEEVASAWAKRHEEIRQQRERLAALRAQPDRSQDEDFERLRLSVMLEGDADWRGPLAEFNAMHPDHASGLYLEAVSHLNRDDAAGLALLERVMALDPEAIKPACERAHAFWITRKDEVQAQHWADRWQARHDTETARQQQLSRLHVGHRLLPAGLDDPTLARMRELLLGAGCKDIKTAYLVRRELPADPSLPTYVLGLDLGWWARQRNRQTDVVNRLAALEWPVHLIICTLDGAYKRYGRSMRAVEGARLQ